MPYEKHDSYNNHLYVDPERTRNVVVNLGYSAVSYTWNVEETEVEDQYTIVTKVTYETNVPVPCVVLDLPDKIDGDNKVRVCKRCGAVHDLPWPEQLEGLDRNVSAHFGFKTEHCELTFHGLCNECSGELKQ